MKRVCVFCGADSGKGDLYVKATASFGKLLAENSHELIYGGGAVGLMGVLADSVLAHGGYVMGIVPDFFNGVSYDGIEVVHKTLSELKLVSSLQERKSLMIETSDAFVALPGGIGTIDELAEVWAHAKLGLRSKPIGMLNINGFFEHFLRYAEHMADEGFMAKSYLSLLVADADPEGLLKKLEQSFNSVPIPGQLSRK